MARRIRFRNPLGRTYGYRALPIPTRPQGADTALDRPLPVRGNDTPTAVPGSRRIIDSPARPGLRQFVTLPTSLETGPAPNAIRRNTRSLNRGAVKNGTGPGAFGGAGYNPPTDGGSKFIPHQRIPRKPITVSPFRRTVDFSSTIPSRGIGAPVK